MTVTFTRIDDRVIHGQTTTRWSKEYPIDGFVVVGDEILEDKLRARVLKAAAGNLKFGLYSEDNAVEKITLAHESKRNFFLITNSPKVFERIHKAGANLGKEINVGPMNTRDGAIIVSRTLALTEEDYNAFEYLNNQGIKISFQLIPEDEKKDWKEIKNKYDNLKK